MKFRTQYDSPLIVGQKDFPPSEVQPGMSPSISQMVRTRSVGGNLDEYQMDGIESDAPFDSEYVDYFEMMDLARDAETAAERQAAEKGSSNGGKPPKTDNPERDHDDGSLKDDEK